MKQTFLLLVGLLWSISLCAQNDRDNPSLRAALQTEGIPAHYAFANDLDFRISSGTAVDTPLGRVFAYYAIPPAQAPNKWQAKAIDREEFVARFGALATERAPDAAMLDALWNTRLVPDKN